ncbi:MAG: UPF0280 family protein [Deltaproteobacteria bacterium]|nr:UPF0280 family protein [Deltaproteobacteria bacterium]
MSYRQKTYRGLVAEDNYNLLSFNIVAGQSDLFIRADRDIASQATESLLKYRSQIQATIDKYPTFLTSFSPIEIKDNFSAVVDAMLRSARIAGVGPMAGIAGAIAEFVGRDLLQHSENIIIENGGDIFMKIKSGSVKVGIFAGESPLSNKISLIIEAAKTPLGVCTSSGTVGESFSHGKADAVCIVAESSTTADCLATAVGNAVTSKNDIERGLSLAKKSKASMGCLIIVGDRMGCWGDIHLDY